MNESQLVKTFLIIFSAQIIVILTFGVVYDIKISNFISQTTSEFSSTGSDYGYTDYTKPSYTVSYNKDVYVSATDQWVDTGVYVVSNDTVRLEVLNGSVYGDFRDPNTPAYGPWKPEGSHYYGEVFGRGPLDDDASLFSLIGSINYGKPFFVGYAYKFVSDTTGALYLAINDCKGCYTDNSGGFFVNIQVATPLS